MQVRAVELTDRRRVPPERGHLPIGGTEKTEASRMRRQKRAREGRPKTQPKAKPKAEKGRQDNQPDERTSERTGFDARHYNAGRLLDDTRHSHYGYERRCSAVS